MINLFLLLFKCCRLLWQCVVVVADVVAVAGIIEDKVLVVISSELHSQREVCSCKLVKEACIKSNVKISLLLKNLQN
jgi:hypothetical protein